MFRPASQCLFRQPIRLIRPTASTRFLTTAPPHLRPRSWKNSAARWSLAVGGVYFYNNSTLFAEEPPFSVEDHNVANADDDNLPSLDSLRPSVKAELAASPLPTSSLPPSIDPKAPIPPENDAVDQSVEGLENDAASQGAFNEETGEINWDCPCLGGMANGPCGEEFKAAFSCFIYSKEEPKGVDCIDKFKGMQDCFREHPETYAAELEDDEEGMDAIDLDETGANIISLESEDTKGVAAAGSGSQAPELAPAASTIAPETTNSEAKRSIYDDLDEEQSPKSAAETTNQPDKVLSDRSHATSGAVEEKPTADLITKDATDATKDPEPKK